MHQGKEGVATDREVLETSALPEDGHSQEGVPDKQRDHTYKCSQNERG